MSEQQSVQQAERSPSQERSPVPSHMEIMKSYENSSFETRKEIAQAAFERALDECGIDFLHPSQVTLSPEKVHELPKRGFEEIRKTPKEPQIFTTEPEKKSGYHLTVIRLNNSDNPEDNTVVFFNTGRIKNEISLLAPGTWGITSEKEYNEAVTTYRKSIHGKFLRGKMDPITYGAKANKFYKEMYSKTAKEYINSRKSIEAEQKAPEIIDKLRGEYTETLQTESQEISGVVEETDTSIEQQFEERNAQIRLLEKIVKSLAQEGCDVDSEIGTWAEKLGISPDLAEKIRGRVAKGIETTTPSTAQTAEVEATTPSTIQTAESTAPSAAETADTQPEKSPEEDQLEIVQSVVSTDTPEARNHLNFRQVIRNKLEKGEGFSTQVIDGMQQTFKINSEDALRIINEEKAKLQPEIEPGIEQKIEPEVNERLTRYAQPQETPKPEPQPKVPQETSKETVETNEARMERVTSFAREIWPLLQPEMDNEPVEELIKKYNITQEDLSEAVEIIREQGDTLAKETPKEEPISTQPEDVWQPPPESEWFKQATRKTEPERQQ